MRGRWRKGVDRRDYLPLTDDVIRRHLTGELEIGLDPLLDGDRCWWLAADFDGRIAMLDALAYVEAARAPSASRRAWRSPAPTSAYAWLFFTAPVPATTAGQIGRI